MNICIIATTLPPFMGGLEVHVWECAHHLAAMGHKVFLIGYEKFFEHRFEKEYVKGNLHLWRTSNNYIFPGYTSYLFSAYKQISKIIIENQIDIVHAHQPYPPGIIAWFLKRKYKIPYVLTSHGQIVLEASRDLRFRMLIKQALKGASGVVGVSEELCDRSIALGAKKDTAVVMSNAVDVKRFHPGIDSSAIRKRYNIKEEDIVILTLRRLVPKTGVQYLIEITPRLLKKNRKLKFLIVGEGPLKKTFLARIEELKIKEHFIFAGSVPNEQVPEYIAACDISLFASLAEATSIACLEVMACGRAIVASNVGGLPEIIEHGHSGMLVDFPSISSTYSDYGLPARTQDKIEQTLLQLISDGELRKTLGANAARMVKEKFSWDAYIVRLLNFYKRIVK